MTYGGIFDYTAKRERLTELQGELENPEIWNNPERAQELGRERARLEKDVNVLDRLEVGLTEAGELLELAREEQDADVVDSIAKDLESLGTHVDDLEFRRMFSGETDANDVCRRWPESNGDLRTSRWTPVSVRKYP